MASKVRRSIPLLALVLVSVWLTGCGIQALPQGKNGVEAKMAEVINQYKRRGDLIPGLVEIVKGSAKHEKDTLEAVTNARARATQMVIDPSRATPQQVQDYVAAQGQLSQALGRLLVASEKYPDLKANAQFTSLMTEYEGTENRIAVARKRLIEEIRLFNDLVTVPPTSWTNSLIYHFEKMAQWTLEDAEERKTIEKAPKIGFGQ